MLLSIRSHFSTWVAAAAWLVSGLAQAGPQIPYAGQLEREGKAANGNHDFRFALFSTEDQATDCLGVESVTEPCGLWWTQKSSVAVHLGKFSVLLGETKALTHTVLARDALWLAIAVRNSGGSGFTLLGGKQRIADVPRVATAEKFTVTGNLVVGGDISAASLHGRGVVPEGGIIMWSGSNIPAGFVLCDGRTYSAPVNGTQTTPDFKDKFVLGVAPNGPAPTSGRPDARQIGNAGVHLGRHTHALEAGNKWVLAMTWSGIENANGTPLKEGIFSTVHFAANNHKHIIDHVHTSATVREVTDPDSELPPYYALAFIMRKLP